MNEDIVSFPYDSEAEYPFNLEMTGISYCDGTYRIQRKTSPVYVFEYILEGKGFVNVSSPESVSFEATKGDIYILQRNSDHVYYSDSREPWVKIWFNVHGPLIDNLVQVYGLGNTWHIQELDLSRHFYKMIEAAKSQLDSTKEIFDQCAITFHEIVIKISEKVNIPKSRYSPEAVTLKNYLDKQVGRNISIKELGSIIYRSPSQTIRIFKKAFGMAPYDYLMMKKVEAAKLLLVNTNMSVKAIAYKLNFADEHYFSNYFKSRTGVSPTKYREVK